MGKRKRKKLRKSVKIFILVFILLIFTLGFSTFGVLAYRYYSTLNRKLNYVSLDKDYYTVSDFGFINEKFYNDQNNNGKDDIEDILEGEKKMIQINPRYVNKYYDNGYAKEGEGVSTDLIWYCFNNAGYDLKKLISKDIENTKKKKVYYDGSFDSNIDFRRISNQEVFFSRYGEELDTDIYNIGEFLPGDVVVFDNLDHIAMISDKYNKNGVPYLVHNLDSKQKDTEENRLENFDMKITGHYRLKNSKNLQDLIKQIKS